MSQLIVNAGQRQSQAVYRISAGKKRSLSVKKAFSAVILYFLTHGLDVLVERDERVRAEFMTWEDGFTWGIEMGEGAPARYMKKTEKGFLGFAEKPENVDLLITFRSVDSAFLVLSGRIGVAGAYARHGFALKGDVARAMSVVRCIDLAEAYLFPRFISGRILKEYPEKRMGILRTYLAVAGHILGRRR